MTMLLVATKKSVLLVNQRLSDRAPRGKWEFKEDGLSGWPGTRRRPSRLTASMLQGRLHCKPDMEDARLERGDACAQGDLDH